MNTSDHQPSSTEGQIILPAIAISPLPPYSISMIYTWNHIEPTLPETDLFVAESATVIGQVTLHPQSSIWFGAVLRGDIEPIEIGPRSNIQDNSVVHTSGNFPVTIGTGVTVGHQVTLHGCTVGDNCLVGMKATLIDGCSVGNNCLIGAGTLIKQHQVIPPDSLVVGFPGRVIRKLTAEEIENIARTTQRYVDLYPTYQQASFSHLNQNDQ